jgi:hypothetical protein
MPITATVALGAVLAIFTVYHQIRPRRVHASTDFTLAAGYTVLGLTVGGFTAPFGARATVILTATVGLGLLRGRLTRVWMTPNGQVLRKDGVVVTIGLLVGPLAATALYISCDRRGIASRIGPGELLVVTAFTLIAQASLVRTRAGVLRRAVKRVNLII